MQVEFRDAALPVTEIYTYNPIDTGMQGEMCYETSSFIGELGEDLNSPEVDCCQSSEQSLERINTTVQMCA